MRTFRTLALALGLCLILGACARNNARPARPSAGSRASAGTNAAAKLRGPQFTGTVVDAEGRPVVGAVVKIYQYGGALLFARDEAETEKVTTITNGSFHLTFPENGVLLLVSKPGLAPAWKQLNRNSAKEDRLILTPPTSLAGVVVDETDKPVTNAEVSVSVAVTESILEGGRRTFNMLGGNQARDRFNARADAAGRFRIEGFPTNATADLLVRAPGKAMRTEQSQASGFGSLLYHAGQDDIRLVVEPAGSIEGTIVFDGVTPPFPAARLMLLPDRIVSSGLAQFESHAQSGADGAFRIEDMAAGSYRLRATFGTNPVPEWVAETVPVTVEAGQVTHGVQVSATRGGLLEVMVSGKGDHKPLAQINVNAFRENFQAAAVSGSNGLAVLRLPPGDYQVMASRQFSPADQAPASVEAGKTNRVEIEIAGPQKITGLVHGPDGQPAAGLEVQIVGQFSPDQGHLRTDAEGRFEIEFNPQRYGPNGRTFCLLIRDTGRNRAVAQDIDEDTRTLDLRLEPGLTLAGAAESSDGKPLANVSATLVFWTGNTGYHLNNMNALTNSPGRFEIPALPAGRRYGVNVSAEGFGQRYIDVGTEAESGRVQLDPVELNPANLRLAGKVFDSDDKPVAGAYVNLSGENQPNANTRTDREGRFSFDHVCEGTARLFANAQSSSGNITAEGGDTNVVLQLGQNFVSSPGSKPRKLKGAVTDPEGQPAVGALVAVFPGPPIRWIKTGTNGAFNLAWTVQPWMQSANAMLVVRDLAHNLGAVEDLLEETTNIDVCLKPALTVAGRVEDTHGAPLANAQVGVWIKVGNTYQDLIEQLVNADAQGRYELASLPADAHYLVYAKAKDHGRGQQDLSGGAESNRVELAPFVLKLADSIVAGQVVNQNDKPVSGVNVNLSGEGQPDGHVTTDSKGRFQFKVCEGRIQLFASAQNGFAQATVEAGDTNIVMQLNNNSSSGRAPLKRPTLAGQPLPDLAAFGVGADLAPAGKPVLVCLFDIEQRPSRRLIRLLSEQHDALKEKGLVVLGIQAAVATDEAFNEWKASSPLPFPVGRLAEKNARTKWASDVEALPWLILADAGHRVVAEGFPLEELDAQLKALAR
jgi:hypothetical protein